MTVVLHKDWRWLVLGKHATVETAEPDQQHVPECKGDSIRAEGTTAGQQGSSKDSSCRSR